MSSYEELNQLSYEMEIMEQKKNKIKKQLKNELIEKYAQMIISDDYQEMNLRECKSMLRDLIFDIEVIEKK